MAYYNDFLMRQISDLSRFLAKALFLKSTKSVELFDEEGNLLESGLLLRRLKTMIGEGEINEAEDLLFEKLEESGAPEYENVALLFYEELQKLDDETLKQANYSREEILEGLEAIQKKFLAW